MSIATRIVAGIFILGSIAFPVAAQPESTEDGAVSVRLIGESDALIPGQIFFVGIDFEIDEGWHLYWKNPGESGAPMRIAFELPEWITAGEVQWPTPERLVLPGDILDYVYHDTVTLLVPLSVSFDAPLGAAAEIKADLWWLMCDDNICVPGTSDQTLSLAVAAVGAVSKEAPRFERARTLIPVDAPDGAVKAVWTGRQLSLTTSGAASLAFYPDPAPNKTPKSMVAAGHIKGNVLALDFDDMPSSPVSGTLEVRDASNKAWYWRVMVPPPSVAPDAPASSQGAPTR